MTVRLASTMTITFANLLTDLGDAPAAMYPKAIIAALVATGVVLLLHLLVSLSRGHRPQRPRWGLLTKLIYLGAIGSVMLLGATSFIAVLSHGAMHGWFLFAHLFGAGAFVVFLLLVALMWAVPSRLSCCGECPTTARGHEAATVDEDGPQPPRFHLLTRLAFWLILVSGVVTAGTMLISMLPVLGTQQMLQMMDIHRYAGLVLVVATIVHLYTVTLSRMRRL